MAETLTTTITHTVYADADVLQSIARAHDDLADGELLLGAGELLNASISRSPYAYDQNPQAERDRCVRPSARRRLTSQNQKTNDFVFYLGHRLHGHSA